jgi:malate dehydrogenase
VKSPIHIAITGAASEPAYALIFRIASGGMFGPEQPVVLRLHDAPELQPKLEASRMELLDCAFPLLSEVLVAAEAVPTFEGAEWIILLGGRAYEPSLARMELLRANAPRFVETGRAANVSAPTARILVAVHPPNTGCLIGSRHAPNIPVEHWFALNRNVRMRATTMIAEKAGVPVQKVHRVTIWGNHSEKMYVDVHNALIDDRPAGEVLRDVEWIRLVLTPSVIRRSFRVRELRGGWPSGTIAQAVLGTIHSITTPTRHHRWFGAGVVSDGSYGIPRGLFFGFPLRTADGRTWAIDQGHYLDDYAEERLAANVTELQHEANVAAPYF